MTLKTSIDCNGVITVTQRQPTRQTKTNATEINKQSYGVNTCLGENLTRISLIHVKLFPDRYLHPFPACKFQLCLVFVVSRVGCIGVTGVEFMLSLYANIIWIQTQSFVSLGVTTVCLQFWYSRKEVHKQVQLARLHKQEMAQS